MRVRVDKREGTFLGLAQDERGDLQAVVRFDNHGLMLELFHPSRIDTIEGKEEGRPTEQDPT